MGLSESGASRFDRNNVELVARNIRMIPKMIEGDLLCRFDQIKVEPVARTKIVARGIPQGGLLGLSESGACRFDRTNVELVAGNIRVVSKIFEGGLSHRFDQINGGIVVKELPGVGRPSHPRCFLGL